MTGRLIAECSRCWDLHAVAATSDEHYEPIARAAAASPRPPEPRMTGAPLKIELLTDICHLSTRLQSAGMIHSANVREFLPGDSIEACSAKPPASSSLTERLAFKVAQLRDSVGQCFARPRLMESMDLEQTIHQGATHG
jgi:hypothetical protein